MATAGDAFFSLFRTDLTVMIEPPGRRVLAAAARPVFKGVVRSCRGTASSKWYNVDNSWSALRWPDKWSKIRTIHKSCTIRGGTILAKNVVQRCSKIAQLLTLYQ